MSRKRSNRVASPKTPNTNNRMSSKKVEPIVLEPKTQGQANFIRTIVENDLTICNAIAGTGKAQPLDSHIFTPSGIVNMGDVYIGQEVCTPDGHTASVNGVFPQGVKDVYSVIFSDGSIVESCLEHLWKIKEGDKEKVLPLKEIMESFVSPMGRTKYKVDTAKPLYFNYQDIQIDPYVLGFLLGDGGLTSGVKFSSADQEIVDYIKGCMPVGLSVKQVSKYDYHISSSREISKNEILICLKDLNLHGKKSSEKHIPDNYLYNSVDIRLSLLQGLMDSDGSIEAKKGRHMEFSTASKKLKDGVQFLVESLGGTCKIAERVTSYTYKGVKKCGRLSYRLHIKMQHMCPFRLSRKADLWKPKSKYVPTRIIKKIQYSRSVETQCISLDSADKMYVTNHCVPTHNTTIAVGLACSYFLDDKVEKIILCRPLAQCGPGAGFLPGGIEAKALPFMHPMMDALDMFLGDSVHRYIAEKKLIISPLETLRGGNLHNSFIILDEMQNASYSQLKMLGTRIGKFSKAVFVGDMSQSDVDSFRFNNTADIQKNFFDRLKGQDGTIGFATLGPEDIIRSRLAKIIAINCP